MALNRAAAVSLYQQIADALRDEIARGRFAPEGRLPPERELMARFGVSRVTVRQAMAQLMREQQVLRKQGKGTFVAGPTLQSDAQSRRGFYDSLLQQGVVPRTQLLEFSAARPDPPLSLADAGPCFFLRRLYLVDEAPIALVRAWLPPEASAISWLQASEHPIYSILEKLLGLAVERATVRIRVQPAGAELARALGLAKSASVLVMERASFSAAGRCLERSSFMIRPERYEFVMSTPGALPISSAIRDADRGF